MQLAYLGCYVQLILRGVQMFKKFFFACVALCFAFPAFADKELFVSTITAGSVTSDPYGQQITTDSAYDANGNNILANAKWYPIAKISLVSKIGNNVKLDFHNGTSVTLLGGNSAGGDYLWAKFADNGSANPIRYNFLPVDSVGNVYRKVGFAGIEEAGCDVIQNGGSQMVATILLKNGVTVTGRSYSISYCNDLTRRQP